ncbi:MAG: hypothetical protein J2P50_08080 [Hyphomicrobiaceae bacterium]|nr:hypothetical protein [Hyphomicrobiaceae bacterium]
MGGIRDGTEAYLDRRAERSGVVGYWFNHHQHIEHAIDGRGMMLAFGDFRAWRNLICATLEEGPWGRRFSTLMMHRL